MLPKSIAIAVASLGIAACSGTGGEAAPDTTLAAGTSSLRVFKLCLLSELRMSTTLSVKASTPDFRPRTRPMISWQAWTPSE